MPGDAVVVRGTNDKPAASTALARYFEERQGLDGRLFIGYPIIGALDGKYAVDAVYISPTKGIVLFDLVDGNNITGYEDRQDEAANKLQSRLIGHRELTHRRRLIVPLNTITFAPALGNRAVPEDDEYPVANANTLSDSLAELEWPDGNEEKFKRTLSAIQSISTIRRARNARKVARATSRGAKLQRLEESIATLDNLQSKAVIETVEGVQRIRGLAGSGKTIVLALKAAYLHAQHPDWRIAVTFNTRSLKDQLKRYINNFTIDQAGEEPNWNNLRVINAWGAPGGTNRDGIYHEFCVANSVKYQDFGTAKFRYGQRDAFRGACATALDEAVIPKHVYDAILVDEAQDFPPEFLRLCFSMLDDTKRLVYAYDELQNLSGTGLPSAADIFGRDDAGSPIVSFHESSQDIGARRDIILDTCYRNSRPVLVTAHALGFGVYRTPPEGRSSGLVQMFDQPDLWTDIGYRVAGGGLAPGQAVSLARTGHTSPPFLENHSPLDDLVEFKTFADADEQTAWVAEAIRENLEEDELRHDDIVVINPDPFTTRRSLGPIRKALLSKGISSHIAGVDTVADVFFDTEKDSVTFTGIYRAKGNEAGMVYVVNAHESYSAATNLARVRNRLFTAITRSKAWVRVLGYGPEMDRLVEEYEAVKAASFELRFNYPTDRERALLEVVHRDMTADQVQAVRKQRQSLSSLIADLEAGVVMPDDLDEALLERLRDILNKDNG